MTMNLRATSFLATVATCSPSSRVGTTIMACTEARFSSLESSGSKYVRVLPLPVWAWITMELGSSKKNESRARCWMRVGNSNPLSLQFSSNQSGSSPPYNSENDWSESVASYWSGGGVASIEVDVGVGVKETRDRNRQEGIEFCGTKPFTCTSRSIVQCSSAARKLLAIAIRRLIVVGMLPCVSFNADAVAVSKDLVRNTTRTENSD
mmetsp:Transcript_5142/g.14960  ORF Transcript_5142/g.14960 Transcript_5142/m.14960 type:complete len:207 (+) Transcript_5142:1867-2487(+)